MRVALENARANTTITVSATTSSDKSKEEAVRDTLSRFATAPRRLSGNQAFAVKEQSGAGKPTMDVDAFKRLLLTGERRPPVPTARDVLVHGTHTVSVQPVSDSGSSADTASISQHSIFETVASLPDGSPRTSDELDADEAGEQRARLGSGPESRKKPAPPKSRRGKPLKQSSEERGPAPMFDNFINSISLPGSRHASSGASGPKSPTADALPMDEGFAMTGGTEAHKRVPPPPPLARRKSQQAPSKPNLTRSASSRHSVLSDIDAPSSPTSLSSTHKAPPPPPLRRSTGTGERRPSLDVTHIAPLTETSSPITTQYHRETVIGERNTGISDNTLPATRRLNQIQVPPVPPPRRGRGSSRSSVDTQRPSMAVLGMAGHGGSDSSAGRTSTDPSDILADLAALQREVDAARASAEGG